MIALVEGAARQKTPNEIALNILLASLTIVFLLAVATLQPMASSPRRAGRRADTAALTRRVTGIVLVSLLVCLIPTTIGALLSAIGIAGMDRLVQRNVLAMSGRAVEAAGDVNTLLLDKTGTITLGNRQAASSSRSAASTKAELADAAQLSCLADETPEGRSIVVLAKEQYGLRERHPGELTQASGSPFTAQTRMCGVDLPTTAGGRLSARARRRRSSRWVREHGRRGAADASDRSSTRISARGGTPLLVAESTGDGRRRRARRHPPQGRRQGRACASASTSCAGWASVRS